MTGTGSVWRTAHGHGFPLVVVHGTMDRSTSFGRLVRALDGFHVTRYDRRGYGRSIELGPPDSFAQQVEDLTEVVGAQPAVVVGHSYGGTVALAASIAHRPIAGAVVYECPMPWMPWWPARSAGAAAMADAADPADAAERFMRRMIGDRRWEKLPPSTRAARRARRAPRRERGDALVPAEPPRLARERHADVRDLGDAAAVRGP